MLVLTREVGQSVIIRVDADDSSKDIEVFISRVDGRFVRVGFEAPNEFNIVRSELLERHDEEMDAIREVSMNRFSLKKVKNQTEKICMAAVKLTGLALEHVKTQTLEICLAAARENGNAMKYIRDDRLRAKIKGMIDD